MQVQAATVAGLGESRVVEEVLFSEEQGTVRSSVYHNTPCLYIHTTATIDAHPMQVHNNYYDIMTLCSYSGVCTAITLVTVTCCTYVPSAAPAMIA